MSIHSYDHTARAALIGITTYLSFMSFVLAIAVAGVLILGWVKTK